MPLVAPELEVPNAAAVAEAVQLPKGYAELPGPLEHAIRPAAPYASSAAVKVALLATGRPALLAPIGDRSSAACAASCFEGSACVPTWRRRRLEGAGHELEPVLAGLGSPCSSGVSGSTNTAACSMKRLAPLNRGRASSTAAQAYQPASTQRDSVAVCAAAKLDPALHSTAVHVNQPDKTSGS